MRIALSAILAILLIPSSAAADQCSDVLVLAAYNRLNIQASESVRASARSWFCSDRFEADANNHGTGGSITIPIEGIPLAFGGQQTSAESRQKRDQFCASDSRTFGSDQATAIFAQVVDRTTINAWKECMSRRTMGASTGIVLSETINGDEITVVARFNIGSVGAAALQPLVVDFFVSGAKPVRGQWLPSTAVTPNGLVQVFKRTSEDIPVSIVLTTTEGTSLPLELRAKDYPAEVGQISIEWEKPYEGEGEVQVVWKQGSTNDHHCESHCKGEPTRTTYSMSLTIEGGSSGTLRNPRLECIGGPCGGWNQIHRVEISGARSAYASWDVWTRPTTWRLSADWVPTVTKWQRETHAPVVLRRGEEVVLRRPIDARAIRIHGRTLDGPFAFPNTAIENNRWLKFVDAQQVGDQKWIRFRVPRIPQK